MMTIRQKIALGVSSYTQVVFEHVTSVYKPTAVYLSFALATYGTVRSSAITKKRDVRHLGAYMTKYEAVKLNV